MGIKNLDQHFWSKKKVVIFLAVFCTVLWGSAVPIVKYSQQKFGIQTDDFFSIILFVGSRIFFAGLISIVFSSFSRKELLVPSKKMLFPIFISGTVQTVIQHLLLYFGLLYTTGARGSISSSTTAIIGVPLAHFFMKEDELNFRKGVACAIGFAGIVILNINDLNPQGFTNFLKGDLVIILSAVFAASGSMFSKGITKSEDPIIVASWQLFLSGILATLIGLVGGGKLRPDNWSSWLYFSYLAFLSATAYAIWTTLLKYHRFSKINIYKSLIPIVGAIISALFLRESILKLNIIVALIFVTFSVFLVSSSGRFLQKEMKFNKD